MDPSVSGRVHDGRLRPPGERGVRLHCPHLRYGKRGLGGREMEHGSVDAPSTAAISSDSWVRVPEVHPQCEAMGGGHERAHAQPSGIDGCPDGKRRDRRTRRIEQRSGDLGRWPRSGCRRRFPHGGRDGARSRMARRRAAGEGGSDDDPSRHADRSSSALGSVIAGRHEPIMLRDHFPCAMALGASADLDPRPGLTAQEPRRGPLSGSTGR